MSLHVLCGECDTELAVLEQPTQQDVHEAPETFWQHAATAHPQVIRSELPETEATVLF